MLEIKEKLLIKLKKELLEYMVFLPENKTSKKIPVILYLHGIGERGNNINLIKVFGLPKYLVNKKIELPYIVLIPQCKKNNFWDYHLRDVEILLPTIAKKYNGDLKRVAIVGTSMGAFGAWNYMMQRPKLFKCLISVAGGAMLQVNQTIKPLKNKSFLIYHGELDDVVNVSKSKEIYNKLKNTDCELKIIKNDNHFLSSHAFKDSYIYEWPSKKL